MDKTERAELRLRLNAAVDAQRVSDALRFAAVFSDEGTVADISFCASALKRLTPALRSQKLCRDLRTYVVRSVTLEPILPALQVQAILAGYVLDLTLGGYGSYMDDLLDPNSSLVRSDADLVLVLLDLAEMSGRLPHLCAHGTAEEIEQEITESITRIEQMLRSYRARCTGRLLVQGCVVPVATALGLVAEGNLRYSLSHVVMSFNERLRELCHGISDCVFFDLDQTAAQYGRARWVDRRMFLSSRLHVATDAFTVYSRDLVRTFSVLFRAPRKVLCTDLDDTLWGGVLGEEGIEGIATGSAFPGNSYLEYQKYLKALAARGILLVIVSKNNEHDVREAFRVRAADLALNIADFAAIKAGWNDKVDALQALARELSLGLDSFVFVDDNPVECEAIHQQLPEVAVVNAAARAPWQLVPLLASLPYFDVASVTSDDVNRSGEYKAQAQRNALSSSIPSKTEFLHSLSIVCSFMRAVDAPLARSAQLLAKTNQFNLTTRRHSEADIEAFSSSPAGQAVAVRVHDRFGDSGVVGLALAWMSDDTCLIDSFLLSCRVIGRGIESALLAKIAAGAIQKGCRWLAGDFIPSGKNAPCADFYPRHGFSLNTDQAAGEVVRYRLDLTTGVPETPAWIVVEGEN